MYTKKLESLFPTLKSDLGSERDEATIAFEAKRMEQDKETAKKILDKTLARIFAYKVSSSKRQG